MLHNNLFKSGQVQQLNFGYCNWASLFEVMMSYKNPQSGRIYNFASDVINVMVDDRSFSCSFHANNEFENGMRDLFGHNVKNEATKVMKFLFVLSCKYRSDGSIQKNDENSKSLISDIVKTIFKMGLGSAISNSLRTIQNMKDITEYSMSFDIGLSSGYERMTKREWNFCCDLFLPLFSELELQCQMTKKTG